MTVEEHVDATLFLGMHSADEDVRVACKSFFVTRLSATVLMSLEQVGRCDDVVWRFPREVQDAYYPFMDNLHTVMRIQRRGYDEPAVRDAVSGAGSDGLPVADRLLLATVLGRDAVLYSVNGRLLGRADLPVRAPARPRAEPPFPPDLERLYRESLALRLPAAVVRGDWDACSVA